jgi:glycosyltransferase involved in cell wall biosynthesis
MKAIFMESQRVPAERIRVIPHGLDLDEWRRDAAVRSEIRAEYGLTKKIVFGAVGRLFWVKGFDELIKGFARIAAERSDVALLIVGDGAERKNLEELIRKLGVGDRVILAGRRTDMASVMSTFDVLLHPSLAESFGLIYVEAMSLRKPVVATMFGIAPEIIRDGENGYFFATAAASIRETLVRVLSERDRWEAIVVAGRASVEKFSVKVTQIECDEYYLSLADAKTHAH